MTKTGVAQCMWTSVLCAWVRAWCM